MNLLICLAFVVCAIWMRDGNSILFWCSIIFFGGGAFLFLFQLLHPKYKFQKRGPKTPTEMQADFEAQRNDPGSFEYKDHGFSHPDAEHIPFYMWSEIESIFVYKKDLYTTDMICMQLFFSNNELFFVTEHFSGWYIFNDKLREKFPTISSTWELEIMSPAFDTMLTLLYDKQGRSLEEALAAAYPKT